MTLLSQPDSFIQKIELKYHLQDQICYGFERVPVPGEQRIVYGWRAWTAREHYQLGSGTAPTHQLAINQLMESINESVPQFVFRNSHTQQTQRRASAAA